MFLTLDTSFIFFLTALYQSPRHITAVVKKDEQQLITDDHQLIHVAAIADGTDDEFNAMLTVLMKGR